MSKKHYYGEKSKRSSIHSLSKLTFKAQVMLGILLTVLIVGICGYLMINETQSKQDSDKVSISELKKVNKSIKHQSIDKRLSDQEKSGNRQNLKQY